MRVGRRARRAAARMRCAQRAVDTRRRRCSARGTQRASTTPSPGARGAPRTHAEAPVTLLPPGAAAERGAAGGARAARLRAVAGQQVHGAAAGLVAAQRGVVLQPVARAVHLHRQPRAEAGRVARGQRVAHLHARRQALPRVLRLLPPPGARPRPLSPPAPARRASRARRGAGVSRPRRQRAPEQGGRAAAGGAAGGHAPGPLKRPLGGVQHGGQVLLHKALPPVEGQLVDAAAGVRVGHLRAEDRVGLG